MTIRFADCTLDIAQKHGKGYPMTLTGPAGRHSGTLYLSPASTTLRSSLARLKTFATDEEFLRQFGYLLFQAMFPPRLLSSWHKNRQCLDRDTYLRLKLSIQPPELAALPWELMCDEEGIPLATSTPIVRFLAHPDPPQPLQVQPPLRILVSIASPRDQVALNCAKEKERIAGSLAPLVQAGLVDLSISEQATGIGLLNDLRRGAHIWHFIGHGVFNAHSANGSLAFENESGDTDLLDAKRLRILLEQSSVRLAVLNGCETGRFTLDPLLGIAPALVRAGVPAVVAMQFAVPDTSAIEFSSMFYRALADGYPVDACVSEGRKAIITRLGLGQPDWAIPVLYMRSPDGCLFQQDDQPPAAEPRRVRAAVAPAPRPAETQDVRRMSTVDLRALLHQSTQTALIAPGGRALRSAPSAFPPADQDVRRLVLAIRSELAAAPGVYASCTLRPLPPVIISYNDKNPAPGPAHSA